LFAMTFGVVSPMNIFLKLANKTLSTELKLYVSLLIFSYFLNLISYQTSYTLLKNTAYLLHTIAYCFILYQCFKLLIVAQQNKIISQTAVLVSSIVVLFSVILVLPSALINPTFYVLIDILYPFPIVIFFAFLFSKNLDDLQQQQQQVRILSAEKQAILEKQNETLARQVAEQTAELKAINTTKDHLFAIIGHDLRSPIASLKGILQLFDSQQLSQEEFLELARHLLKNVDNIHEMLENLLQWSLSQMQGLKPFLKAFEVNDVVDETIALFKEVAFQKQIELATDLEQNLIAFADENQIRTVLRNLLNNAIKFTPQSGIIAVSGKVRDNFVELKVIDSGIGIKTEDLALIFSKPKLKKGTAGEKGTGLGLVLCKDLIEQNGGQIVVRSEYQKGTTFEVILPKK
jgi:signal transduction histidine kinase